MTTVICDPLIPVKSGAQDELDTNLSAPYEAFTTFSMVNKTGDLVVPENVHARFYNCVFDQFTAIEGNNNFYFEQCTFTKKPIMKDVTAIAAGTKFKKGFEITASKLDLIVHDYPNTNPATALMMPIIRISCEVNDSFFCLEHSVLKSLETIFEWLEGVFEDIFDAALQVLGPISAAIANSCGAITGAIQGVVGLANKAMANLLDFSRFESMLDKFLNIPFTIINMITGCVTKITNMAFGLLDSLLGPLFNCIASITALFNSINNLITTIKNIPDRIAVLVNGCYLRIIGSAQLMSKKIAFFADYKSKIELQLNQRIIAANGGIALLDHSSKMVLRNCGMVVSPSKSNTIPMFEVNQNSLMDISRVQTIGTANAPIVIGTNKSMCVVQSVDKVQSTKERSPEYQAQYDAILKQGAIDDAERAVKEAKYNRMKLAYEAELAAKNTPEAKAHQEAVASQIAKDNAMLKQAMIDCSMAVSSSSTLHVGDIKVLDVKEGPAIGAYTATVFIRNVGEARIDSATGFFLRADGSMIKIDDRPLFIPK